MRVQHATCQPCPPCIVPRRRLAATSGQVPCCLRCAACRCRSPSQAAPEKALPSLLAFCRWLHAHSAAVSSAAHVVVGNNSYSARLAHTAWGGPDAQWWLGPLSAITKSHKAFLILAGKPCLHVTILCQVCPNKTPTHFHTPYHSSPSCHVLRTVPQRMP